MTDIQPSLGEFLRQERERRGITIEQVASATKISVRLLHSVEADQYAEMPAKPFIRGFVTSYARFIGLDSKEILTRYDDFIDSKVRERPTRDAGHSGYAFEKREGEQSRTMLWVVMGVCLVVGGVLAVFFKGSRHHHKQTQVEQLRALHPEVSPSPAPSNSPSSSPSASGVFTGPLPSRSPTGVPAISGIPVAPVAAIPSGVVSPAPKSPMVKPPSPKPSAKPSPKSSPKAAPSGRPDPLNSGVNLKGGEMKYKSVFKALADVWVRYQVDERPMTKFILREGRVLVLRAEREIRFQASNPASITLNLNGQGTRPLSSAKSLATRQGNVTFFAPSELSGTIQEPFPGERPLPASTPPVLRIESDSPAASE